MARSASPGNGQWQGGMWQTPPCPGTIQTRVNPAPQEERQSRLPYTRVFDAQGRLVGLIHDQVEAMKMAVSLGGRWERA